MFQESQNEQKTLQNLHITNPSLTAPSHTKLVTHQTGDPLFLDLKGEDSKAAPKKRPRGTKSRPRAAKSQPSDAQEAPKSAPNPSKMESGEPQDEFLARSLWEALFDKLLERFCVVFFAYACSLPCIKNLDFCRSCQCCARVRRSRHVKPTCMKKL